MNEIYKLINEKYEFLRLCVFNLILSYTYVKSYLISYKEFLNFIRASSFPLDYFVAKHNVYTLSRRISKSNSYFKAVIQSHPRNTRYLENERVFHKYIAIKILCHRLLEFEKEVIAYKVYLQKLILCIIANMKSFRELYILHIYLVCNPSSRADGWNRSIQDQLNSLAYDNLLNSSF